MFIRVSTLRKISQNNLTWREGITEYYEDVKKIEADDDCVVLVFTDNTRRVIMNRDYPDLEIIE